MPILAGLFWALVVLKLVGEFDGSWWIVCFPLMVNTLGALHYNLVKWLITR